MVAWISTLGLGQMLREELKPFTRIYLEASTSSAWAARLITANGHEPIVVDPRRNRLIAGSTKKTDKNDAATLANLGRVGLLSPVYVRSAETEQVRRVLTARAALVDARGNLSRTIRALHRSEGHLLPGGAPEDLTKRLLREGTLPHLGESALPLAQAMDAITVQIADTEAGIDVYAALHKESVAILKSIPGVGPIVSVGFLAHLEDVGRFTRPCQVAAYFGLVPWVSESAGKRQEGGITGHGNKRLRKYLIQAAHAHMKSKEMTALKQWTLTLMERVGRKKECGG